MDREKVIKGIKECDLNGGLIGNCPYKDILELLKEQEHKDKMFHALEDDWKRLKKLLKEQEEREKAICKEICDFIRGACSTDTDDDKDFVCYEIQRCFTHFGRSVKWE